VFQYAECKELDIREMYLYNFLEQFKKQKGMPIAIFVAPMLKLMGSYLKS
jgi:hypothetical protein